MQPGGIPSSHRFTRTVFLFGLGDCRGEMPERNHLSLRQLSGKLNFTRATPMDDLDEGQSLAAG
jgi:hypothetical protein